MQLSAAIRLQNRFGRGIIIIQFIIAEGCIMKIDYQRIFDGLKERGLIKDGDKYAVCLFKPESKSNGVTITTITSKVDYIVVVNNEALTLLDIDKRTGEFLESGCTFRRDDLVFEKKNKNWVWASKFLWNRSIDIRADFMDGFKHTYMLPGKHHGFDQKAAVAELFEYVKAVYNAHHDEQKRLYKERKKG